MKNKSGDNWQNYVYIRYSAKNISKHRYFFWVTIHKFPIREIFMGERLLKQEKRIPQGSLFSPLKNTYLKSLFSYRNTPLR